MTDFVQFDGFFRPARPTQEWTAVAAAVHLLRSGP